MIDQETKKLCSEFTLSLSEIIELQGIVLRSDDYLEIQTAVENAVDNYEFGDYSKLMLSSIKLGKDTGFRRIKNESQEEDLSMLFEVLLELKWRTEYMRHYWDEEDFYWWFPNNNCELTIIRGQHPGGYTITRLETERDSVVFRHAKQRR